MVSAVSADTLYSIQGDIIYVLCLGHRRSGHGKSIVSMTSGWKGLMLGVVATNHTKVGEFLGGKIYSASETGVRWLW